MYSKPKLENYCTIFKKMLPLNSLPEMEGRLSRRKIIDKGIIHWKTNSKGSISI